MKAVRVSKRLLARDGRFQREDNVFLELPTEILTEVAKWLDWKDVLHLRQTCKHLSQATRAKTIWVNFFNVSNISHPWTPLRLEQPLEFCTSEELEYLVLRRASQEMKRATWNELPAPTIRRLRISLLDTRALTLIPGGRWLLVVDRFGGVSYYDLDAQKPVKRPLIPPAPLDDQDDYLPCSAKIAVDMDNDSALLSFNLALYTSKSHRFERTPRIQLTQIWYVTLKPDDQKQRRTLSATFRSSFHREDYGDLSSLSLLGRFIAFGVNVSTCWEDRACIAIVDWAKANSSHQPRLLALSYLRKMIHVGLVATDVQLLPGDKILIVSVSGVRLFDVSSIEARADIPSADQASAWPHPSLIWEDDYPTCRGVSQLYRLSNANELRLIYGTRYAVYGIIIPYHSGESQPKIMTLLPLHVFSGPERCHYGYNSAVTFDGKCLGMVYYSWPEDSDGPSSSFAKVDNRRTRTPEQSVFDECSGRLAVKERDEIVIYDFSFLPAVYLQ